MADWRTQALQSLAEARQEIEAAAQPTIVVILTIGSDDLMKERPLSVYANQNWRWLQRMMAYAAWRFSLRADDEGPCATPT